MNPSAVLSPEIVDLGLAVGLLKQDGSSVEFDSDWFSDPGPRVSKALADDDRRAALVRFVDTVNGESPAANAGGITLLKLFDARELGLTNAPALVVNLSVDDRDPDFVEVGIAVSFATSDPIDTRTDLVVPLYRTGKLAPDQTVRSVDEPFALMAGAPIRLATSLILGDGVPDAGGFGLRQADVAVVMPVTGAAPNLEISLIGLRLPGSTTATDIHIGGPGSTVEDALLSLVLGIVRAGAGALGAAGATALHALDLIGLGDDPRLPPLDAADIAERGVAALRDWFALAMADATRRTAWLDALGEVIGGGVDPSGVLAVDLNPDVALTISVAALPGAGGHLVVTPRLGLRLRKVLGTGPSAVVLSARAEADVLTVNLADGHLTPVPRAEVFVAVTGNGTAKLLDTGPLDIRALELGVAVIGGQVAPLLRMLDVKVGTTPEHPVVDLSSVDAVVAAAGQIAGDLAATALDAFPAGVHLKPLLGIVPTGGMPALDAGQLLVDPLGALRSWWHSLVTAHQADVPAVLGHLRDLIADDSLLLIPISGAGTEPAPWRVPIVDRVTLDAWVDGGRLLIAVAAGFRVDDLAGGCTVVETDVRAELAAIDLANGHASLLGTVELRTALRGRGMPNARLALGPVAVVADSIGVSARWAAAAGFGVTLVTPGLAAEVGGTTVPLALPIGSDWRTSVFDDVERLVAVLAASNPTGWLADAVALLGWQIVEDGERPRLSLAGLADDPAVALREWALALVTDSDLLERLANAAAGVLTGAAGGIAGAITGRGTPDDPWVLDLGSGDRSPALALALGPSGPVGDPSFTTDILRTWRPGLPALPVDGLARAVLDEAAAGADGAAMAFGRGQLATGLTALALRAAGTDVLVAPPPAPIAGVEVLAHPAAAFAGWGALSAAQSLGVAPPAGAAIVWVAVGSPTDNPWPDAPAARLVDLSTRALPPESFTVADPAGGDWFVQLASRADASLGVTDPGGVLGQAARLGRVLTALGSGRPVVVIAIGGAGHAARLAADATPAVSHLATLGTPWSAVAFDTYRNGVPGDALRLLRALLPAVDTAEPDDADLALGRAIVEGGLDTAAQFELEAPRPATAVRAGLAVRALFGALEASAVERALTAVVSAGLAERARARAIDASQPARSAELGFRLPFGATPQSGSGITVEGELTLGLMGSVAEPAAVSGAGRVGVRLRLGDSGGWLIGGPGTTPPAGAPALELRLLEIDVSVGLDGAPSRAELTLHEVAALGAYRERVVVRPPASATGTVEELPFLPEARAVVAALVQRLRAADPGTPAATVSTLLEGLGLAVPAGLDADQLSHLLHDPAGFATALLGRSTAVNALVAAAAALIPGATATATAVAISTPSSDATVAATLDLAARRASVTASGRGMLPWSVTLTGVGGQLDGSFTVGAADFNGGAVRFGLHPFAADLVRHDAAGTERVTALWPSPDADGIARFALAALPAEALRVVLTGLRQLDGGVGPTIEALAGALGMLTPALPSGTRQIVAPVALFDDPGRWLRNHVLGGSGTLVADRVIDLFEAIKPFVGLDGTPRGVWPIVPGVQLSAVSAPNGATVAISVDPTNWLTGAAARLPFAAGASLGLTIAASGNPEPAVDLYLGVAAQPQTAAHRGAVHVLLDGGGIRVLLRPTTGADIGVYPNPAGIGQLLATGTDLLVPMALNELAKLSGDPARTQVAALVKAFGVGLELVDDPVANPVTFSSAKLHDLADDPGTYLGDHLDTLVTNTVAALHPLINQLPGAPTALLAGSVLTVTVRGVALIVDTNPFTVGLAGSVSGIPLIGTVAASLTVAETGLTGWSFSVGPAAFDLGGPVLRPFVRGGRDGGDGWSVAVGLGLDAIAPITAGHKELFARWRETDGLAVVARTRTAGGNHDATDPGAIALFAADAVLELLGNYVIDITDVSALLDKTVNGSTVRSLLQGSVLSSTDDHAIASTPVSRLPGSLFVLGRKLAGALPQLPLGPITLGLHIDGDVVGLRVNIVDPNAGLVLNQGQETVIAIVTDSSWIEPPSPPSPPPPGVVIDLLTITTADPPVVTVTPAFAANGLGVKITKSSGPLLDAGLRLDGVAVHLFGKLVPGAPVAVSGGVHLELIGLGVPLGGGGGDNAVAKGVMADAGGSGAPPAPKFSPAIAVQGHHGVNGVAVSLRAGTGDGPWYLPIQRAFGPVYIDQVGLGTGYAGSNPRQLDWISVSLDGSVSLFGIAASVEKLRLTYHVNKPIFDVGSWTVDLDGFAISSSIGGLTLAGALLRSDLAAPLEGVEYLGMLKIGFNGYGLALFGGYANPDDGNGSFASFFAFGALHAPLGGVPAFFITGIGLGFGINRELKPPSMDTITSNPFLVAMKALGPTPDPKTQLKQMSANIGPARGEYWVAAGISFTSFVLISGEVVITVAFGDGLEITVLGLARAELPTPVAKLVSIELALMARFSTKEGVLMVQAQLTENSWLLTESVRLTGGFAFATWWKGPNAGQFVVTMGGYHPKFNKPGYPVVPRLGLSWKPIPNVSIVGETYFALCSEALMAGVKLEASAKFGPAYARLSFGADGIVFFDPFWFEVTAWAEIAAGIKLWLLFGTVTIELSLGADVTVTGPPVHVEGRFHICGFEVPFEFGEERDPTDARLTATQFRDKYLRAASDAQMIQASVMRGAVTAGKKSDGSPQKVPDGSPLNPFLVIPEFELVVFSTAPAIDMELSGTTGTPVTRRVAVPELGVAPMFSATLESKLHAELSKIVKHGDPAEPVNVSDVSVIPRASASFPKGVWGEPQNRTSPKVPAGATVDASDGFTISTVLGDLTGAPAIDYHQVELPFHGRKPLPFVANRGFTDDRAVEAATLRAIADALRPADADVDARFNVAARLLEAGGYGTLGVAALRGERAAAPSFGSLADDLVVSPDVVSPAVTARVVDHTRPAKRFIAPRVTALMATPVTTAAPAAGVAGPITTVKDPGRAVARPVPGLDAMRSDVATLAPATLLVRRAGASPAGRALVATGRPALTRLATAPTGLVANARPDRRAGDRLDALSAALSGTEGRGAVVHDGEVVVVTVVSRPMGERTDVLQARGGGCRVVALAAGGRVLFDESIGERGGKLAIPHKTERVVVTAAAGGSAVGGRLDGWYLGQNVPSLGWDMALAAGTIVTFADNKARPNRERADGGWVNTREMTDVSRVSTRFDRPVRAVAIAVDEVGTGVGVSGPRGADAVSIRLVGASRVLDAAGQPEPPDVLVQGVRTVLVYAIEPELVPDVLDPNVLVIVDGTRQGHLAGVAGWEGTPEGLVDVIAASGFDAAIAAAVPGGTGERRLTWTSAATPEPSPEPRPPARATTARKTPAKQAPAKKTAAKKTAAKKTTASKTTAKKATASKTTASKTTASKTTASKTAASKTAASKTTAKKSAAKKSAAKKTVASKAPGKKTGTTRPPRMRSR